MLTIKDKQTCLLYVDQDDKYARTIRQNITRACHYKYEIWRMIMPAGNQPIILLNIEHSDWLVRNNIRVPLIGRLQCGVCERMHAMKKQSDQKKEEEKMLLRTGDEDINTNSIKQIQMPCVRCNFSLR